MARFAPAVCVAAAVACSVPRATTQTTRGSRRPEILLITEGTYPYVMGGVSTWCDVLVTGLRDVHWQVLPITAGGNVRTTCFELPPQASLVGTLDLWADALVVGRPPVPARRHGIPGALAEGLLAWNASPEKLLDALAWCNAHPSRIRAEFARRSGWTGFLEAIEHIAASDPSEAGPVPHLSALEASELYQALYWAARAATQSVRDDVEVVLLTAAGWGSIVASLFRRRTRRPVVLAEHGVYLREAYLAQIRSGSSPGSRWGATRLARGLARLAYANSDVIAPVTQANVAWELHHGAPEDRIQVIYNGVLVPTHVEPAPGKKRVVTIGRVDPLKDVLTLLEVAAFVIERDPAVTFSHFGPYGDGRYFDDCLARHGDLRLGERFRFHGPTETPENELAAADVSLLTSRSEGFPISVLEAMACGRPVVATSVGGVAEAIGRSGYLAAPGDVAGLAAGVLSLVGDPALAEDLGRRARARVIDRFGQAACLESYRDLLSKLSGHSIASAVPPEDLIGYLPESDQTEDRVGLPRLLVPGRVRRSADAGLRREGARQ